MKDQTGYSPIVEQVREAATAGVPLRIRGGGSKDFLGREPTGQIVDMSDCRGIVHYEPTELAITARAGTPLTEIESALADHGQVLGFEPPHFSAGATLGGTIACGLSGPARPFLGAARDFVLGTTIVNGKGELLHFGGEVMKNVAGYDVSRLMCGAYGTLGVLMDISLKVLPRPAQELTLTLDYDSDDAFTQMARWQREPLPLSGLCYDGNLLYVRLAGAERAVAAARRRIGGDPDDRGQQFWQRLRDHQSAFFGADEPLWRVSVPATTAALPIAGKQLIEWGGALRWIRTRETAEDLFAAAHSANGHATQFAGSARDRVFQPLPSVLFNLHKRLKQAFDPVGVLNPERMYAGL